LKRGREGGREGLLGFAFNCYHPYPSQRNFNNSWMALYV
jgi:hypothetical protein